MCFKPHINGFTVNTCTCTEEIFKGSFHCLSHFLKYWI